MDFLIAVENTALATWIRESPSLLAYAFILFLHSAGLALLVGFNAALNLRILGVGSEIPASSMDRFYPVMVIGFWINAVSGFGLLIASASTLLTSPLFYTKLGLIVLAVINLVMLRKRVLQNPYADKRPLPLNTKLLAVSSMVLWMAAMTAGRFQAYLG